MALAYGLALWERYTRSLLGALDGHRACFVHYERLLAEPEAVARELVAFCVDEPLSDEPERLAAVVDYLDGGHRHQTGVEDDVLSPAQAALDEALLGLSGPLEPFRAPSLPPETANLQLAFDEAKRLSFFLEETDRLQGRSTRSTRSTSARSPPSTPRSRPAPPRPPTSPNRSCRSGPKPTTTCASSTSSAAGSPSG